MFEEQGREFDGCTGIACAGSEGSWKRVGLSLDAQTTYELVPRTDTMLTSVLLRGPEGSTWGTLYLQDNPPGQ